MPLEKGNSQEAIHKNIKRLIDEGKPKDQAVAIAYNVAQDADLKKLAELFDQWLEEESNEPAHAEDEWEVVEVAQDADKWITVKGARVKVNEKGEAIAGANGKLNKSSKAPTPQAKVKLSSMPKDAPKHLKKKMTSLRDTVAARTRNGISMSNEQTEAINKASELLASHGSKKPSHGAPINERQKELDNDQEVNNAVGYAMAFSRGDTGHYSKEEETKYKRMLGMDSERSIDNNGHLIVKRTVITKAAVNPYRGSEIPNSERLGLDPNRIYYLLRCPVELERGMNTFAAVQLLKRHIPVDATDSQKESTVGAIGSEFEMDDEGRVWAMLRVHDQEGIDYIQSGKMQELSAGYAYTPDMTEGVYNGEHYDGVMRNIQGNHVAIVERGRIGRDAIVADYMPNEIEDYLMTKKVKLKQGSIAELKTRLGMDSDEAVKAAILAVHGALALDSDDKEEKKAKDEDDEVVEVAEDEDEGEKANKERKELKKTDKDDREAKKAEDEDDKPKKAMDAATIESNAVAKVTALFEAREKVKPIVGQIACDSAEEVYKTALKQIGVSTAGVHPSAFGAMVDMHLAGSQRTTIAQDSAPSVMSSSLSTFTKHIH